MIAGAGLMPCGGLFVRTMLLGPFCRRLDGIHQRAPVYFLITAQMIRPARDEKGGIEKGRRKGRRRERMLELDNIPESGSFKGMNAGNGGTPWGAYIIFQWSWVTPSIEHHFGRSINHLSGKLGRQRTRDPHFYGTVRQGLDRHIDLCRTTQDDRYDESVPKSSG